MSKDFRPESPSKAPLTLDVIAASSTYSPVLSVVRLDEVQAAIVIAATSATTRRIHNAFFMMTDSRLGCGTQRPGFTEVARRAERSGRRGRHRRRHSRNGAAHSLSTRQRVKARRVRAQPRGEFATWRH